MQGTGTAGRSFKRRPWLRMGCCVNDDDDDDDDDDESFIPICLKTPLYYSDNSSVFWVVTPRKTV